MLFYGGVSVLSFCYRDLSAWWEIRPDQPDTQYHFVIADSSFLGVPCVYRYHFEILRYAKALKPPEKTPPEAIIESLCIVSTKCGNDTQITVLQ